MIKCDPKAFMKCPVRMKHCKTEEEAYFCDGSDCHKFNQKILAAPKTNADRIRSMSDRELAVFLEQAQADVAFNNKSKYAFEWEKWLRQPAEVVGYEQAER